MLSTAENKKHSKKDSQGILSNQQVKTACLKHFSVSRNRILLEFGPGPAE